MALALANGLCSCLALRAQIISTAGSAWPRRIPNAAARIPNTAVLDTEYRGNTEATPRLISAQYRTQYCGIGPRLRTMPTQYCGIAVPLKGTARRSVCLSGCDICATPHARGLPLRLPRGSIQRDANQRSEEGTSGRFCYNSILDISIRVGLL